MIKNEKYWEDYTIFIKEVERFVNRSPLDVLNRYLLLIEELEDDNEDCYLEW